MSRASLSSTGDELQRLCSSVSSTSLPLLDTTRLSFPLARPPTHTDHDYDQHAVRLTFPMIATSHRAREGNSRPALTPALYVHAQSMGA